MAKLKLNLNKSKDLERLQEEMNNIFEQRIREAVINESIQGVSALPLGTIKNIFESISDRLYSTAEGKKLIGKYIKCLKENKNLRTLYSICDSINKPSYVADVNLFLNEAINYGSNIDIKKLAEEKSKFSSIVVDCIKESKMTNEELTEAINANKDINESIDYLLTNKKSIKTLSERANKTAVLSNYINENMPEKSVVEEGKSVKELLNALNETFDASLESWEMKVAKDIALANLSNRSKKELFEGYKAECIKTLDTLMESKNVEDKSRFSTMKSQLENKEFSEETLSEDLLNLAKLNYTLTE